MDFATSSGIGCSADCSPVTSLAAAGISAAAVPAGASVEAVFSLSAPFSSSVAATSGFTGALAVSGLAAALCDVALLLWQPIAMRLEKARLMHSVLLKEV